ncbi:MAG: hypothetical protein EXQ64_06400 [Ilumatobacteraceae bacterium]|nr:hypothetical protein [Ilumatobacteraceae bacterium]
MESLALLVSVILLVIVVLGIVAVVLAKKPRRTMKGRIISMAISVFPVLAGGWLMFLDVGIGARALGAAVAAAGVISIWRNSQKKN